MAFLFVITLVAALGKTSAVDKGKRVLDQNTLTINLQAALQLYFVYFDFG